MRWKCDLAGQVSAMLRLLQMDPSKVLATFLIPIQSSWQLSLLELSPLPNHCDSLFGLCIGALNYFTFFRPILSILSAFRNPILTHLPLSGFLSSLLCALIAPTSALAFSPPIPRTLAAALSFSSGRAYPFLNFLHPLFLRLILTLIM